MAIIVVATTKGGSGKSTLAACLAAYWSNGQGGVEALDTDPNRNLLARLGGTGIACTPVDEEAILPTIGEASKRSELVIIDVAGTLARGLLYAVSAADIVLIPCRPDRNDVVEAVRTQEVIRQAEAMTRRKNSARCHTEPSQPEGSGHHTNPRSARRARRALPCRGHPRPDRIPAS